VGLLCWCLSCVSGKLVDDGFVGCFRVNCGSVS
jgi:hypothetical protein